MSTKNRIAKDWVTIIIDNMEQLNLKMTFEEIKYMKKDVFMSIVKRISDHKTLKDMKIGGYYNGSIFEFEENHLGYCVCNTN